MLDKTIIYSSYSPLTYIQFLKDRISQKETAPKGTYVPFEAVSFYLKLYITLTVQSRLSFNLSQYVLHTAVNDLALFLKRQAAY